MGHFDFSLFPVNLRVVVLEPVVVLSQGLDDLGTTRGECLGRTR